MQFGSGIWRELRLIVILWMVCICHGCVRDQIPGYDLVISNVSIPDLQTGKISKGMDVFIRDSIIVAITPAIAETHAQAIDGSGKYLIPGLWDMHVHLQDTAYLQMMLEHGIVGARDMGGCVDHPTDGCESLCPSELNRWRNAIANGTMLGPQLFISGPHLSGTGWLTAYPATSVREVRAAFEKVLNSEVDFIKVYEKIPEDAYREISRLSEKYGIDFCGHVSHSLLLSEISDLGQKSVEHVREPIFYSFTSDSMELAAFMTADGYSADARAFVQPWIDDADNVIEAFKRNHTWFTPTMAVEYARQRWNDTLWIRNPLRLRLPEPVATGMHEHLERMRTNPDKKSDKLWWEGLGKLVKRFHEEGIGLLAGSDIACEGGIPGFSLHEELWLMVEAAGLTPLAALQTATVNPCQYFNLPNRGKVKPDYYADLLLLEKNPLENIRNTLSVKATILNGRVVASR